MVSMMTHSAPGCTNRSVGVQTLCSEAPGRASVMPFPLGGFHREDDPVKSNRDLDEMCGSPLELPGEPKKLADNERGKKLIIPEIDLLNGDEAIPRSLHITQDEIAHASTYGARRSVAQNSHRAPTGSRTADLEPTRMRRTRRTTV
jgi:hypothetical protein